MTKKALNVPGVFRNKTAILAKQTVTAEIKPLPPMSANTVSDTVVGASCALSVLMSTQTHKTEL